MRGLIRLIVLAVVVIGGYWAYYVFAAADPNDRFGVEINRYMPEQARKYACDQLKQRFGAVTPPPGCAGYASWGAAPAASGATSSP